MNAPNKPAEHQTPPLAGLLVLDKPEGISSMKAVAIVRRRAGGVKTGHAGTLDPLATGVLVLALGRAATRHIPAFMGTSKRYHTLIDLSAFTTTDDREGELEEIEMAGLPDEAAVRAAVAGFVGEIMQRPPAFSAIKIGGHRAYKLARQGDAPTMAPRPAFTHSVEVIRFAWPQVELDVHCAKGFYIRSLARELGTALGTGGHCLSIRRTAVGPFGLEHAIALDDVPDPLDENVLLSVEDALAMISAAAPD